MAYLDLTCKSCGHKWRLSTFAKLEPEQRQCPDCGSEDLKQSVMSYLRNGPLSHPGCGAPLASAPLGC
jgi:hypothetical protein